MSSDKNIYDVFHGDSVEILKTFKKESFDHIITDPPYNISRKNNFHTMKVRRTGLDFGEWDKGFDITAWIANAVPLIKKGGNIVIFNSWRNLGEIADALEEHDCEIKDCIRWVKNNPMPRNRDRRFIVDYEFAVWSIKKGSSWTFNRIDDKFERPEIKFGLTPKSEKEHGTHTTQKPLNVMKWLIERLSNPKDIILDPFMGSGSTGVACKELDRSFVGIELDDSYFKLAKNRIGITDQNQKDCQ